jgi:hypothetical protein
MEVGEEEELEVVEEVLWPRLEVLSWEGGELCCYLGGKWRREGEEGVR